MKKRQVVLIILDGWGHSEAKEFNAIYEAKTPNFEKYWDQYPHSLLHASGESVGLPNGQMGNSEVGHMTIGAGRPIDTDLIRISKVVKENKLAEAEAIAKLFEHVLKYDSTLHVQGLIGPGGVHSHSDHLYGFLKEAKLAGIEKIAIHAFTDGRDTPPQSASKYLKELEEVLDELGMGFIATATGRFFAMDRDGNWERLEKAEKAIFEGKGKEVKDQKPSEILERLYLEGKMDEHIEPIVFLDPNGKSYSIENNDGIFFFNYRADRARMFSEKILEKVQEKNLFFVSMTNYDDKFKASVAFPPVQIETTLANEISKAGLKQVHIAETEKFAHATYFLNGGRQEPHENEEDILIESSKHVLTHDLAPKMKAKEIADTAVEKIKEGAEFIFINFANADMIGHTANKEALLETLEEVDFQLQRVVQCAENNGAVAVITADHGNAEMYFDQIENVKHTSHTTNRVPFILTDKNVMLKEEGNLYDIAPTVLELLGLERPAFMTGESVII